MINVLIPIVDKKDEYQKFVSECSSKGIKFYVGAREKLAFETKDKNTKIFVFSNNAQKEEIINSLHAEKMEEGKILVIRRPISKEEFEKLVSSTADITALKKKRNKFSAFFKRIAGWIVRKIFAFNFFEDISAVCFGQNLFDLLKSCSNLSTATRVNRFVGVSIEEIETNNVAAESSYNKPKTAFKFLAGLLFFLGSVTGVVLISIFCSPGIVHILFMILWLVIALAVLMICLMNLIRTITIGELGYGKAERVSR